MKTLTKKLSLEKVLSLPKEKPHKPIKPSLFWRCLIRLISIPGLLSCGFTYKKIGMEKLGKKEPCLILMNHSCFLDLQIAETLMFPRPMNIVCTSDGFVGKNLLMRLIGCIPTNKFVNDIGLVRNMRYALTNLKSSILMFPEASYSFDGTATVLPDSIFKCIKLLGVPVVMIRTYGAFSRNPLYNNLQIRKNVKVSADVKYLLSKDDVMNMPVSEIASIVKNEFAFDSFKWQQENNIKIEDDFRADSLNRVLFKCPACKTEGKTVGKGISLTCNHCGKVYELTPEGFMKATTGETEYKHIPDWFNWQREEIKKDILEDKYNLDVPVEIYMLVNTKAIYKVGYGNLKHNKNGFVLDGCDGKLHYEQKPRASYSLYSDYYWYEIGDVICIGDMKTLYYCFPQTDQDVVARSRIATEEIFKLCQNNEI
ncbi:MAG: 1-acyl-sn-glycerol-3-phosphate acyltransferase [Spirochaetaceae bacterium]|nr:1-acyl-sn-glycerol-3-phosphate acyltransferase [Spirochaetaceae bacterium]